MKTIARKSLGGVLAASLMASGVVLAQPAVAEDVDPVPAPQLIRWADARIAPDTSSTIEVGSWTAPFNNRVWKAILHYGTTVSAAQCADVREAAINPDREIPLNQSADFFLANQPGVNMSTIDDIPLNPPGSDPYPRTFEKQPVPVRWNVQNAGGYICTFTEMQFFVPQGQVIKKAFSPRMRVPGSVFTYIKGGEYFPRSPSLANGESVARPGTVDILATLGGSGPQFDETVENRELLVSVLTREQRNQPCESVSGARTFSINDFQDAQREFRVTDLDVGKFLCLRQTLKTNWMAVERASSKVVLPIYGQNNLAGLSRLFAASSVLANALRNVELLQVDPTATPDLLQEAADNLRQASEEAEAARQEAEQQGQLNPGQNVDPNAGQATQDPAAVAQTLKEVQTLLEESETVAKSAEAQAEAGASAVPLSATLRNALKTGAAPLVSVTGNGEYQDSTLRVRAPKKQKRGTKKRYRAIVTPKETGRVSFALVRLDDSGEEVVEATKIRKLNKKGKKSINWRIPKKMPKGGYTLYVSIRPSKASGKAPFTVARTIQIR